MTPETFGDWLHLWQPIIVEVLAHFFLFVVIAVALGVWLGYQLLDLSNIVMTITIRVLRFVLRLPPRQLKEVAQ